MVSALVPQIPSPDDALKAAGPAVGPLSIPKWVNVGIGGLLGAIGLYAVFKGPPSPEQSENSYSFQPSPPKDTMTTVAGIGSIAGAAYILLDSFGYKRGK